MPPALAGPVAFVLPAVELTLAAGLLTGPLADEASVGALVLLAAFTAAIATALARGKPVDCQCFGRLQSAPVGPWTLVRNLGLLARALFAVAAGWSRDEATAGAWLGGAESVEVLTAAVVALGIVALVGQGAPSWQLLRKQGRLLMRLDALEGALGAPTAAGGAGLAVGAAAPPFRLPTNEGGTLEFDKLHAAGRPVLIVFSDPGCGPCVVSSGPTSRAGASARTSPLQ